MAGLIERAGNPVLRFSRHLGRDEIYAACVAAAASALAYWLLARGGDGPRSSRWHSPRRPTDAAPAASPPWVLRGGVPRDPLPHRARRPGGTRRKRCLTASRHVSACAEARAELQRRLRAGARPPGGERADRQPQDAHGHGRGRPGPARRTLQAVYTRPDEIVRDDASLFRCFVVRKETFALPAEADASVGLALARVGAGDGRRLDAFSRMVARDPADLFVSVDVMSGGGPRGSYWIEAKVRDDLTLLREANEYIAMSFPVRGKFSLVGGPGALAAQGRAA